MTDDRFFALIGRVMAVFALLVVAVLVAYAVSELYRADQGSLKPVFTLAPDSTPHKAKP